MGTVRQRKDGGWFVDYVDATGRRVRELIGPGEEKRRLARRILAEREAEAVLGQHRVLPAQTPHFGEFADGWLRRVRARGLKPKTIESYEATVNTHLRPVFGEMRLGAIIRRDIEAFVTTLAETGTRPGKKKQRVPLSSTTVNYALCILKFVFKDAVEQGHLSDSPAAPVRSLRSPDDSDGDRLHFLQPEEIRRLLEVAEEPYGTLYRIAVYTGLRRGEILGLRWRDLDLQKGMLYVRRTLGRVKDGEEYVIREAPLKTRHSRRVIDLSVSLVQALLDFPAGDDPARDYLFCTPGGGPLDPDNLTRTFQRHLTLAGIPEIRFHDLRHTHASLLIAAGVHPKAIQARMGHANITTTLNTYGHLMPSAFEGVSARLDALLQTQGGKKSPESPIDVRGVGEHVPIAEPHRPPVHLPHKPIVDVGVLQR